MTRHTLTLRSLLFLLPVLFFIKVCSSQSAIAQSIVPAADGTGTIVTPTGNQFDIQGGQLSGDGANLFHSLFRFGLNPSEVANFMSNPGIQNILTRVTGGDASVINGLIQVTGGYSNLYLMNPAGILLGPTASLNVPAAFTATTATGIGFGSGWFNASGSNNYAALVGTPTDFAFTNQPGSLINAATLVSEPEQSITLLGGIVINTGNLSTPNGKVTIAAIPNEKLVRISQEGSLLSLDLPTESGIGTRAITPISLPELLTGGDPSGATGLGVENQVVTLRSSGTEIPQVSGTAIVSGIVNTAGQVVGAFLSGGEITVVGDRVGVVRATLNASGLSGGGTIRVGGDYQGMGPIPNATLTYVSPDSIFQADSLGTGNGGRVIVWSDRTTLFNGSISAQGGVNGGDGGFVEVSGKENLGFNGTVDTQAPLGQTGTLLLDPQNIDIVATGGAEDSLLPQVLQGQGPATTAISAAALSAVSGNTNILLEATDSIRFSTSVTFATGTGSILFQADADRNGTGAITIPGSIALNTGGRAITLSGATLSVSGGFGTTGITTGGGNVTLSETSPGTSGPTISVIGGITTGSPAINSGGGTVTVTGTRVAVSAGSVSAGFSSSGILSGGGTVSVTGTETATITGTDSAAINSNGGTVTVTGGTVTFASGAFPVISPAPGIIAGSGAVTVAGDTVNVTATVPPISGTGSLTLQPSTPNRNIALFNTSPIDNALNLTSSTLSSIIDPSINPSFSAITIGSPSSTGTTTLNAASPSIPSSVGSFTVYGGAITTVGTGPIDVTVPAFNLTANTGNVTLNNPISVGGGGILSVTSQLGSIVSTALLRTNPLPSNSGGINLTAAQAITTSGLTTGVTDLASNANGGNLTVTAGGNITITGNVLAGNQSSGGGIATIGNGGNVSFTSTGGAIDTSAGVVASGIAPGTTGISSGAGNGGNITYQAQGNITTGDISSGLSTSSASGTGGSIRLTSNTGSIQSGVLLSGSLNAVGGSSSGRGGDITATANSGTFTALALASGSGPAFSSLGAGNIVVTANQGISITGGVVTTASANAGTVTLSSANGPVRADVINTQSVTGRGGDVTVTTGTQFQSTSNLNTFLPLIPGPTLRSQVQAYLNALTPLATDRTSSIVTRGLTGGNLTVTAGDTATIGDIFTRGSSGQGGNVTVIATNSMALGAIDTGSTFNNAGNVTLDPIGDIQVSYINAQGGSSISSTTSTIPGGRGGDVNITTGSNFRATGVIPTAPSFSILTSGGTGAGDITIRHGGNGVTPFVVGDASRNGTAGAITTGVETIATGNSYLFTYTQGTAGQGQIGVISVPQTTQTTQTQTTQNQTEPVPERFYNPPQQPGEGSLDIKPSCGLSGAGAGFQSLEQAFTSQYERYLGTGSGGSASADSACNSLANVDRATGVRPALIYASFVPAGVLKTPSQSLKQLPSAPPKSPGSLAQTGSDPVRPQPTDELELLVVTANGGIIRKRIPGATRAEVLRLAQEFRAGVTDPRSDDYLIPSQQLYQWLVAPVESDLKTQKVTNLAFIMDVGLRSLPIAALHDGKGFLVERYSLGLMPSISLTDTRYRNIRNAPVLGMGAAVFRNQNPLPAVPVELQVVTQKLRSGKQYLNEAFTVSNLKAERSRNPVAIVHLATHGEFRPGSIENSYIQFWDQRLRLNEIRGLGLNNPPVELLVLSACRTALGNEEAELGFGGLAVQSGAKTALASLWYVSDEGTLGLMTEFYDHLSQAPIKAEALRQAQMAMLKGKVRIEDGKLRLSDARIDAISLPPELSNVQNNNLAHPYYWSGFTMIGNPW
ncbi:MAG: CHAT domain-containing protein [Leptolyngbyaceae cyanobacterium bins.59]|nr:CHAT domain-containing protein [Leptolyngbyaceae cyanobacterium bins.59]